MPASQVIHQIWAFIFGHKLNGAGVQSTFQIGNKLIHRRQRSTCVNIIYNFMETYVLQHFFIYNVGDDRWNGLSEHIVSKSFLSLDISLRYGRIRTKCFGEKSCFEDLFCISVNQVSICSRLMKFQSMEKKECDYAIFGHRLRIPVPVVPFLQNCLETEKFKYLLIK